MTAFWRTGPAVLFLAILFSANAQDLPLKQGSVRFAVIGDMGTGDKAQYEVAQQMERSRQTAQYTFVLMLGDNIYGGKSPADMKRKFDDPYKPLLDADVKFYASLGNHDDPNERFYKPFNMNEKRYYSFKKGNAQFFALDSNYMDPAQMDWLTKELRDSNAQWKICYFHHPLYSDGKFHGPDTDLRARLEPILQANGVKLVLSGHEHLYERIKPHNGIFYFVLGNSGELRPHNLRKSPDTAMGFDTDRDFMMVEIAGDQLYFQTVSRTGETIDSGVIDAKQN
jgi:3',5'-cyclic AMP phosphodiesterase CpdA